MIRDFFLLILWHFCDILLWRDWFQKGEVLSLSQPPTSWLHWQLLSKTYLIISIFNFRFLLFTSTFYFFRPKLSNFSVFTSNLESKSSSSLAISDQNLTNLLWNPVLIRKKFLKMKKKLWRLLLRGRWFFFMGEDPKPCPNSFDIFCQLIVTSAFLTWRTEYCLYWETFFYFKRPFL